MEADARVKAMQSSNLSESRVCPQCHLSVSMSVTRCPNDGASLLTSSEVGTELASQFEFLSVIASGGMGTVYEARHLVLDQKVAIKMMRTERLDERNIRRFRKEAKALSALEHKNVIHVRDYGLTENGQPYIVLEYVEGMSMSQMIQSRGPIPFIFALQFFIQITEALAHAHERGVLHQDLKPNNIMICEPPNQTPYAKLIDFGIAKIIDGEATPGGITSTGDVLGSPAYMSPEQANGGRVDSRTDIYSLGCVMFEALTGTQPFKGATALEVISHQINTIAPSIEDVSISEFPSRLAEMVAKTLEKDPNKRFQSMNDLRKELLHILADASDSSDSRSDISTPVRKISAVSLLMMCGIALCLAIIFRNASILSKKDEAETARQLQYTKNHDAAGEAAHYDQYVIAHQIIQEQLKNWKPGGDFNLKVENYDADLEEFSHHPAFVTYIDLENSGVKGPGLAYLIRYPLDYLSLNESSITDRAFLEIKHMKNLRQLQVDNVSITSDGLKHLQQLQLRRLSMRFNRLNDAALKNIAAINTLEHLQCGKNDRLTSVGYSELSRLPNLKILDINENPVDLKTLQSISKLHLIDLNLEGTSVDNDGLKVISAMSSLHNLGLRDCQHLSAEGLKYLAKIPDLNVINFEGALIGDNDVVDLIKKCPKLNYLDLRSTNVTDKTMELIADSGIENLCLQKDKITDSGLRTLLKDKRLKHLELDRNPISKEAIASFARSRPGVIQAIKPKVTDVVSF